MNGLTPNILNQLRLEEADRDDFILGEAASENGRNHFYEHLKLTTEASNVSESTRTNSPVSAKRGTAMSRTTCPSGPSIVAVSNFGWEPTKNRCGQEFNTNGSSSWNG